MHEDDSPVERLNESLYSRTAYKPPEDVRSPVRPEPAPDAPAGWDSPEIDSLIAERRKAEPSSRFKKFFIVSVIIFLVALGVAGYIYFGGGNFISTKNVDISVTGPAAVNAGDPLSLSVTIDNKNNAPLDGVVLSIQYPDGTRQADNHDQALSRDQEKIDTLAAGGESVQTFRAALFGQKGDVEEMKLTLEYKVAGSSATFYKDKTFDVTIGDTPLVLGIEHPSTVTSGEGYDTRIIVASNSSDILHGVVVRAEYPYGYSLATSDPAAAQSGNLWTIGDLAPGDKKTITIHGSISGVDAEERTFRYYAGEADPGSPDTLKDALVSTTDTVTIARPDVGIAVTMNGQSGDYVAPMGGNINATISYVNNSTSKLTDTVVTARITGTALDKGTIKPSEGGFYDSNTGLVTWSAPGVSSLAALAPGDQGSVSVSFASLPTLPVGQSQSISLTADITGTPDGVASADKLENSATELVKISSAVNFSGKALYSRGPFKNVGPFPPKAEATTTYTVVLDLGNTQNDVSNGKVTASLGPNVKFAAGGSGSGDPVSYDAGSNTLTWDVGTLASGAGFSGPEREAVFQVAILPSIGQIGTVPTLVQNISFLGTDSFTNLPVSATLPAITTHLSSDPAFVQGDDAVVK